MILEDVVPVGFKLLPFKFIVLARFKIKNPEYFCSQSTLGVVEKEEPYTVRLLFEPSGRPMPDADYYTTEKDNVCVVCGSTDSFVRKMIVPHDYRKYFPATLKDHTSHDVLLMCLGCHRYEINSQA